MSAESVVRALLGGALIGFAAALVLVVYGRIAGISGFLGRALDAGEDRARPVRIAFLAGLIGTGVIVARAVPAAIGAAVTSAPVLAVAGLLVGAGTTLANGCTSGHGVCGIGRGSKRSFAAVATFMGTAMATVAIVGVVR